MTRRWIKKQHTDVSHQCVQKQQKQHTDVSHKRTCLLLQYLTLIIFLAFPLSAEQIIDRDFGYSLDLPEGYEIQDYTEDGLSYLFSHPNIPVTLALKVVKNTVMTDTSGSPNTVMTDINGSNNSSSQKNNTPMPVINESLQSSLKKLKATTSLDTFSWNNTPCAISEFSFTLDQKYKGWAIATPTSNENYSLVLLCYAPLDKENKYDQFIISTLNSLCIAQEYYKTPGIITSYAFPKEGDKKITLELSGKKIQTTIDKVDEEASKFVVDLEYSVLILYANHKSKIDAWKRYYRMIYRDSFSRLENVSADIYENFYESQNSQSSLHYAQTLLSWVQTFPYQRASSKNESDFTCLSSVICGKGSDCDSRSMLLCVLLKSIGIETLFLFSPEYAHAIAATQIDAPGQTYELPGVKDKFIFGETTAKVTWGMISQSHSDRSKWIPVILP